MKPIDIPDGLSHTLLVGEKCLAQDFYHNGLDSADNQNMYLASTGTSAVGRSPLAPLTRDRIGGTANYPFFGSAHPSVCQFVFCDGSVHSLSYHGRWRSLWPLWPAETTGKPPMPRNIDAESPGGSGLNRTSMQDSVLARQNPRGRSVGIFWACAPSLFT